MGYVNAVRAAFMVAPDPDNEKTKFLMPIKFNLGPKPMALSYRLASLPIEQQAPILAQCDHLGPADQERLRAQLFGVEWLGAVDRDADDVVSAPTRQQNSERRETKCQEAADWILDFLAQGARPSDTIFAAGNQKGFGERLLFAAKKLLGPRVKARKNGFTTGWEWYRVEEVQSSQPEHPSQSSDPSQPSEPVDPFHGVEGCED